MDMALVVIQGLLQAFLAYIAFHVTVHPVEKEGDKMIIPFFKRRVPVPALKSLIVVSCLAAILLNTIQLHFSQATENKNEKKIGGLTDQIGGLTNQLTHSDTKISDLNTEIADMIRNFSNNTNI